MGLSFTPTVDRAEEKLLAGDLRAAVELLLARAELGPIPKHPPIDFDHAGCRADAESMASHPRAVLARMVIAFGVLALMRMETGENPAWMAEEAMTMLPYADRASLEAVLGGGELLDRFLRTVEALRSGGT